MKVLHITNWYPNTYNKKEALWIQAHINSLDGYCDNEVIHFEIFKTNRFKLRIERTDNLSQFLIELPFEIWFLNELIHLIFLFYIFLVKRIHVNKDLINFHIAYPMLTYWHLIKRWIKKPSVITEHWSTYHFNFGVKKKLPRVQKIFQQRIPIITVSQALADDIEKFAKVKIASFIVPNVIDEFYYHCDKNIVREDFFFMISNWGGPKLPILAIKAFLQSKKYESHKLVIGGYGTFFDEMKSFVEEKDAAKKVIFKDELDKDQIAFYMQRCNAFLHPSKYETFSVVCAEATYCGAFVIASNVGGIPEVVDKVNSTLLDNDLELWINAVDNISNPMITTNLNNQFNSAAVGEKYCNILIKIRQQYN